MGNELKRVYETMLTRIVRKPRTITKVDQLPIWTLFFHLPQLGKGCLGLLLADVLLDLHTPRSANAAPFAHARPQTVLPLAIESLQQLPSYLYCSAPALG